MFEILRRALFLSVLAWSVPAGAAAGALTFLGASRWSTSTEALALAAALALVAVTGTLSAVACRRLFRSAARWWVPAYVTAGALVVAVAIGAWFVLDLGGMAHSLDFAA